LKNLEFKKIKRVGFFQVVIFFSVLNMENWKRDEKKFTTILIQTKKFDKMSGNNFLIFF